MEGILNFLTPATISLIIDGLVLIFILFGFLWGAGRGLRKAGLRGINVVLTAAVLVFILPFAFDALFKIPVTINLLGITMHGETLNEFITGWLNAELPGMIEGMNLGITVNASTIANTVLAVQGLLITIITAVIFPVLYMLLNILTWPIYAIVAACTKTKSEIEAREQRKRGNKKAKAKKYRWWGGLVGAAQAAFIAFIFLLPVGALSNLIVRADDTINSEMASEFITEDIKNYLGVYSNSVTGKVFGFRDIDKTVFGLATTKTTRDQAGNEVQIKLMSEADNIIDTANTLLSDKYFGEGKIDIDFSNFEMSEDVINGIAEYLVSTPEGETEPVISGLIGDIINPVYGSSVVKAILTDTVNLQLAMLKADGYAAANIPSLKVKDVKWDDDKGIVKTELGNALVEVYNLYTIGMELMGDFEGLEFGGTADMELLGDVLSIVNRIAVELATGVDLTSVGRALDKIVDISLLEPVLRPTVKQILEAMPADMMGIDVSALGLENVKFETIFGSAHSTLKLAAAISDIFSATDRGNLTADQIEEAVNQLSSYIFDDTVTQNIMLEAIKVLEDLLEDNGVVLSSMSTKTTNMTPAKWAKDKEDFAEALTIIAFEIAYELGGFTDPLNPTYADAESIDSARLLELGRAFDLLYDLNIISGIKTVLLENYDKFLPEDMEFMADFIGIGNNNVLKLVRPSDFFKIAASLVPVAEAAGNYADSFIKKKDFAAVEAYLEILREGLTGNGGVIDTIADTAFFTKLVENSVYTLATKGLPEFNFVLSFEEPYTRPTATWTTEMADSLKDIIDIYFYAMSELGNAGADNATPDELIDLYINFAGGHLVEIAETMDAIFANPLFRGFKEALIDSYITDILEGFAGDYLDVNADLINALKEFTFTPFALIFEDAMAAVKPLMDFMGGNTTKDNFVNGYDKEIVRSFVGKVGESELVKIIMASVLNKQLPALLGVDELDTPLTKDSIDWENFANDLAEGLYMLINLFHNDFNGITDEFVTMESLVGNIMGLLDMSALSGAFDAFALDPTNTENLQAVRDAIAPLIDVGNALDTLLGWNNPNYTEGINPLSGIVMALINEQLDLSFLDDMFPDGLELGPDGVTFGGLFASVDAALDLMSNMDTLFDFGTGDLTENFESIGNILETLKENPAILSALKDTISGSLEGMRGDGGIADAILEILDEGEKTLADIIVNEADTVSAILDVITSVNDLTDETGDTTELEAALDGALDNLITILDEPGLISGIIEGLVSDASVEVGGEPIVLEDLLKEPNAKDLLKDLFAGLLGGGLPLAA